MYKPKGRPKRVITPVILCCDACLGELAILRLECSVDKFRITRPKTLCPSCFMSTKPDATAAAHQLAEMRRI